MKKLITAGIALGLFGTVSLAQAQEATAAEQLQAATNITSEWVEARSSISKEINQWRVNKELIQQKIDFYKNELEGLQEEIDRYVEEAEKGKGKRAEYSNQIEELNRAQKVVLGILPKYESQVKELAKYFPSPLENSATKLAQSIPSNPENTRMSVGARLAVIVGILNEVDRFNRDVTTNQEVRTIGDKQIQVEVMYLGFAQAFYADSEGTIAGIGTPAKGGWKWEAKDEMAPQILRAIQVAQGKIKPAEFVELPLQMTNIKNGSR